MYYVHLSLSLVFLLSWTSNVVFANQCFADRGELKEAVDEYIDNDCTNVFAHTLVGNTCNNITQVYGWPMGSWCVGNVTSMRYLFSVKRTFNEDLNAWDTGFVTNFEGMFSGAREFNSVLSSWNTSSATTMKEMFSGARSFNSNISNWDVSNVGTMRDMVLSIFLLFFFACSYYVCIYTKLTLIARTLVLECSVL